MLQLVLTYRNQLGSIQQDVSCLQHRVIQNAGGDAFLSARLLLELRLSLQLAERSESVEYPGELGMFRHPRLNEQRALFGIETGCEEAERHVRGARAQVGRIVRNGDRVIVDDAEKRLVFVLQLNPVLHGAEVISNVQGAGGLNAAEDAGHCA